MKYIILALAAMASPVVMSMQMAGFGATYYQDDSSIPNYDTSKNLSPDVIIGGNIFVMEFSNIADIAKATGVTVNQGDQASWLCLKSKDVDYWFISDNEMGQGDLTSIALARAGQQKGCSAYSGDLSVSIKGIPLLNVSLENLSSIFSNKPAGNVSQYCSNTNYGGFTQMNCIKYYIENKNVGGLVISQITAG
jgi:hypothetical protein